MSYHFLDIYFWYYLPDLSKWNICKLIDADCMFAGSTSLELFPDLSKWNTSKFIINKYSMDNILSRC